MTATTPQGDVHTLIPAIFHVDATPIDYILLGPMLLDRYLFEIFCGISREDGALRYRY
jgi:hypothetical protein